MAWIRISPALGAGRGINAFDDFFVFATMMEHQLVSKNGRRAVARADRFLPKERWSVGWPFVQQTGLARDSGPQRTEKARPIFAFCPERVGG